MGMMQSDVFTIDGAWGLYTVSREKANEVILSAYVKAIEAIKERNYTASDIRYISCVSLTEYALADNPDGTRDVPFVLYVDLQDEQRYRRLVKLRVSTKAAEHEGGSWE
jgi:hypothetical protein